MANRASLIVNVCLTPANGHAEGNAALAMIEPLNSRPVRITHGAGKGYEVRIFVNELRAINVRPQVSENTNGRRSAINGRTARHTGYAISQRVRKCVEGPFGWMKTVGGQRKAKFSGVARAGSRSRSLSPPQTLILFVCLN